MKSAAERQRKPAYAAMFEFSPSQVSEAVRTDLRVTLVKAI